MSCVPCVRKRSLIFKWGKFDSPGNEPIFKPKKTIKILLSAFNNLWLLFLSTPRYDSKDPNSPARHLPFIFTGGLGMDPQTIGLATSILGVIGMILQFTIYPKIQSRLGTAKSYQYFLIMFPAAYALAPYISLKPSSIKRILGLGIDHIHSLIAGYSPYIYATCFDYFAEQLLSASVSLGNCSRYWASDIICFPDSWARRLGMVVRIWS